MFFFWKEERGNFLLHSYTTKRFFLPCVATFLAWAGVRRERIAIIIGYCRQGRKRRRRRRRRRRREEEDVKSGGEASRVRIIICRKEEEVEERPKIKKNLIFRQKFIIKSPTTIWG